MKRIPPGLALLLLAPILAELLSGHQPPLEFFNPLNFAILSLPYGCGALICRELVVRWRKGRFSLLLLGIAYALYEEGIVVRSIFDPNWGELENLGAYSHVAGVTWTYAALLIHFHVVVSIISSVILAEILYPEERHQSWVGNKALGGCFAVMVLWLLAGFFMTSYFPPIKLYISAWLAIFVLVWAAKHVQAQPLQPHPTQVPRSRWFWLLGFVNMTTFFLMVFLTPQYCIVPFYVTASLLISIDGITLWLILRWSGNGFSWNDYHCLAFIAGGLTFFITAGLFQDIEEFRGLSIVGIIAAVALWQLSLRVKARQ